MNLVNIRKLNVQSTVNSDKQKNLKCYNFKSPMSMRLSNCAV